MKQVLGCIALVVAGFNANVVADDRQAFNTRSAERYVAMFRANDVDADNVVTRHEARNTLELAARFADIDINRDGTITWEELQRYIEATFR